MYIENQILLELYEVMNKFNNNFESEEARQQVKDLYVRFKETCSINEQTAWKIINEEDSSQARAILTNGNVELALFIFAIDLYRFKNTKLYLLNIDREAHERYKQKVTETRVQNRLKKLYSNVL